MGEKAVAIRILIVDDHAVVRQGLKMFLQADRALHVVGEAAEGREALRVRHHLDVETEFCAEPELSLQAKEAQYRID